MWKDYSIGFIRKNRASSLSVLAAAFISALFLSLLCSLSYNLWKYEIESITLEEGSWQGRISGTFNESIVSAIQNFANVKTVQINTELSDEEHLVIDICFQNMRTIYQDLPLIAEHFGVDDNSVSYHELLLSRYLIHAPQDTDPPLLMAFYLAVLLIASVSLILIIHNSFAVSMKARIHQLGILSSIGATPGQIRACLLQEAAALCILPILLGTVAGIALSFGTIRLINALAKGISGRHEAVFAYHPILFVITILSAILTVYVSAWLPARKLSKLTPLAAIQNIGETHLKKRKKSPFLSRIFGVEGELAGATIKAQKKALRTSTLSLTLSFLGFTLMLCFFTLSGISTNHTYFERYQNAWDIMVTVKDTNIENFEKTEEILQLNHAESVIYQKAAAQCAVPEASISDDLHRLGGLESLAGNVARTSEGVYSVQAPIIIMDDNGFKEYCKKIGIKPEKTGCIVLNRIWDSINSNFRYKEYVPFLTAEQNTILLQNMEHTQNTVEIPVLAYTQEPPVLREEYENYTLVQFIPLSTWRQVEKVIGNAEPDTYIRILAENSRELSALNMLETKAADIMEGNYTFEIENRIQEKIDNDAMLNGYKLIVGALCVLLAIIGIANIFSYTLGFVQQRKREFARYMSIGMTPESMKKMFCIEALVIAGRPVLITLPLTLLFVGFMVTASYLNPMEFLKAAPIMPIVIFILVIFGFVALAYYIGGRKIMKCNLIEALQRDHIL